MIRSPLSILFILAIIPTAHAESSCDPNARYGNFYELFPSPNPQQAMALTFTAVAGDNERLLLWNRSDGTNFPDWWLPVLGASQSQNVKAQWPNVGGTLSYSFQICENGVWRDKVAFYPTAKVIPEGADFQLTSNQDRPSGPPSRGSIRFGADVDHPASQPAPILTPAPAPQGDIAQAINDVNWAWNDNGPCTRFWICATYFDSFGLNITFSDGSVVPFAHVQRLTTSAHDCIQNALNALHPVPTSSNDHPSPNRGLAVEWVMATQIHNRPELEWLRAHPDAVIAAIQTVH